METIIQPNNDIEIVERNEKYINDSLLSNLGDIESGEPTVYNEIEQEAESNDESKVVSKKFKKLKRNNYSVKLDDDDSKVLKHILKRNKETFTEFIRRIIHTDNFIDITFKEAPNDDITISKILYVLKNYASYINTITTKIKLDEPISDFKNEILNSNKEVLDNIEKLKACYQTKLKENKIVSLMRALDDGLEDFNASKKS